MTRWSLGNRLLTLDHMQFVTLTNAFRNACAKSWGQDTTLDIKLLNQNQVYTTFYDEDAFARLKEENDAHTLMDTAHTADISASLFHATRHIIATVRPSKPESAPASAFGNVEFKGNFNRRATFYVQPGGEDVRDEMLAANPKMVRYDGFESHGSMDGLTVLQMAGRFGIPGDRLLRRLGR